MTLHEKALQIRAAREEQELKKKQERMAVIKEHLEIVEQEFGACFARYLPLLEQHGIKWSAHLNTPNYVPLGSYIEFEMDGKCLKMDFRNDVNYQYKYTGNYHTGCFSSDKDDFILFLDEFFFSEKPEPVAEHKEEVMRQKEQGEEMRKAEAIFRSSIDVVCPYCDIENEITEQLVDAVGMGIAPYSTKEINAEVTCYDCGEKFIVTKVEHF